VRSMYGAVYFSLSRWYFNNKKDVSEIYRGLL
jgi:hypothetical protein